MTQITIDADLARKLADMGRVVELCDPSGRVLGRFVPLIDLSEWEPVEPDISEEELREREQSTEWYTTDEVLAYLKSWESQ